MFTTDTATWIGLCLFVVKTVAGSPVLPTSNYIEFTPATVNQALGKSVKRGVECA